MSIPVITIDGPSASGKGTIAAQVAHALGWHVLDSGALYRAAALSVLEQGVNPEDMAQVARTAAALHLVFAQGRVLQSGRDISAAIRAEAVGIMASRIATQAPLRTALLSMQRAFRQAPGLVADGRDMGTQVFPDAALKIFLHADAQTRALRRHKQLKNQGVSVNLTGLVEDLRARDAQDRNRRQAPLLAAPDAKAIDSSALTIAQTVDVVLGHWSSLGVTSLGA